MNIYDDLPTLLKNVYDTCDIDFVIDEAKKLTEIEFKQTFREYRNAAKYVYNLLQEKGINAEFITFPADGKTTYQDFRTPLAWEASYGRVTVLKSEIPFEEPVVADYERHPFHLIKGSSGTKEGGVRARLLTEEQVLNGEDATGVMVLFPTGKRVGSACISPMLDRGAIGFISNYVGRGKEQETPDCIAWCNAATDDHSHWHVQSEDREFIGFSVSPRTGETLHQALAAGEVEVLVESDARRYEGEIDAVCGYIPGKSEKEIWLIAHLFEPFITDNSLSASMVIEIARKILALGTPNYSLRLVFSAETYGLAAVWDYYKDRLRGKVLGAIDIDTPPAFTYDNSFDTRFNPYCSPFYGNYMFLAVAKAYEKAFPNTEKCVRTRTEFGDDLIMGDPTIGVPTIYFEEEACIHWHSSYWSPESLDPDKVRRSYAICAAWTALVMFLDEDNVCKILPECVKVAQNKLNEIAKEENSKSRMEYFLNGERQQILDFLRAVNVPEIEKAADTLHISPTEECEEHFPALERIKNIIPSRATEGFPYDLIRIPYEKRKPLPNGVIYGAFATIIAKMDGEKSLCDIILEAAWEHKLTIHNPLSNAKHFVPLSDKLIEDYIDAVYYLTEAGYFTIKEKYL